MFKWIIKRKWCCKYDQRLKPTITIFYYYFIIIFIFIIIIDPVRLERYHCPFYTQLTQQMRLLVLGSTSQMNQSKPLLRKTLQLSSRIIMFMKKVILFLKQGTKVLETYLETKSVADSLYILGVTYSLIIFSSSGDKYMNFKSFL